MSEVTRRQMLGLGAFAAAALTTGCTSQSSTPGPSRTAGGAAGPTQQWPSSTGGPMPTNPPPGSTTTEAVPPGGALALVLTQSDAEMKKTWDSVRKLDNHPLIEMTWYGASVEPNPGDDRTSYEQVPRFGCTLFAALGDLDHPVVARNFDWSEAPAALVHHRPSTGHRALAMADLSIAGVTGDPLSEDQRPMLPRAGAGLMDGINEHGLFVGCAADETSGAMAPELLPGKLGVGSVGVMRLMLDRARTVREATEILLALNIDMTGGPVLHYLLVDRTGEALIAEYHQGEWLFHSRQDQPWWCLENFHFAESEAMRASRPRYSACAEELRKRKGIVTMDQAAAILGSVTQSHTQWSIVYDLATGDARLVTSGPGKRTVHKTKLKMA